ncbi:MAG TPA: PEP-CTERM sorting domain-containing protein [Pirellulales bacterium]|jgi:hypothetical protein|nr:PEP-CTERM sorting domain-containing protein [Pirellulales bacterium]
MLGSRSLRTLLACLLVLPALAGTLARAASIGLNFTGVTLSDGMKLNADPGYAPPDNSGAVGSNNIVQLINGAYAVYDKATGAQQQVISGKAFWIAAGVDPGTGPGTTKLGAFNQRILYDPASDRWIAAALTGATTDNRVLIARSDTSNPLGTWRAVSFLGNDGGTGKFADYTRLGVDANGVYVAVNNFTDNTVNGGFDSQSIFSIPKTDLLAASPTLANMSQFFQIDAGDNGMTIQPAVNFGPTGNAAPLIGTSAANSDNVLFRSSLTGTAAANVQLSAGSTFSTLPYDQPPMAAQPDGTRSIQTIDNRIASSVYQVGGALYAVHQTVVGNNVGIHWLKIDAADNHVIEEGIISNPAFDYFQPSIGANANGDIVIGFTRSGFGPDGNLTDVAVVGKTVGGTTTFGQPLLLKASSVNNYHYLSGRWGDYTTTLADPFNPNSFWTFQEYALGSNAWATQITQILVPEPGSLALAGVGFSIVFVLAYRRRSAGLR